MANWLFPAFTFAALFTGTMYAVGGIGTQSNPARGGKRTPVGSKEILYKGRRPRTLKEGYAALRSAGCEVDTDEEDMAGQVASVYAPSGKSWAAGDPEVHSIDILDLGDLLDRCRTGLQECDPDCPCGWDR